MGYRLTALSEIQVTHVLPSPQWMKSVRKRITCQMTAKRNCVKGHIIHSQDSQDSSNEFYGCWNLSVGEVRPEKCFSCVIVTLTYTYINVA